MNIIVPSLKAEQSSPTEAEARAAVETLKRLFLSDPSKAEKIDLSELTNSYPAFSGQLNRIYPADFEVTEAYKATLPDLQNGPESLIKGARKELQHVGISNFSLPLAYRQKDGKTITLETSVTGSVSLEASKKGINMSRIMRSFYRHSEKPVDFALIDQILDAYIEDLGSYDARLQLRLRYPMLKPSLRSGLEGYQYYDVAFEVIRQSGDATRIIHLDYVYSSTCPCSLELSEHARRERGQIATPHSQRSVARVSVALKGEAAPDIEDLIRLCQTAILTETQVMVKREDEQAFAELNGANPIFVEDAARLLCKALESDTRIGDFRVLASHQESLHSHDAVSVLIHGKTFDQKSFDPRLFESLFHTG